MLKGIAVSATLVILFGQCTKIKTTDIGSELIPTIDNVLTFDTTLTVVSNNYIFGDSAVPIVFKDLSGNTPEHLLGFISNDPQFGKTEASIFMELKPPFFKYFFENVKDSLFLDSVVLSVKWNSTWGDTIASQKINVYELDNELRGDSAYYTNSNFRYSKILGSKTFSPQILKDSLFLFRQSLNKQLRIRLSDAFGKLLLSQDSATGQPFSSDSAFRAFFKGFAIVPENPGVGGNALMSFTPSDSNTNLSLYYKYIKNGKLDTTRRGFVFKNTIPSGNANRIKRDHTGSQLANHLTTKPAGDSIAYVQAAPGTYNILRIPSVDGFKALKGNVMVHLAELRMIQIPGAAGDYDNFLTPPPVVYIDFLDTVSNTQFPFLTDALSGGRFDPVTFGGVARNVIGLNGQIVTGYNFFITRYIQNMITRNSPNFPIYLYSPYTVAYTALRLGFGVNRLALGRVQLGGGSHSSQKMTLRIIYSKI
jgi:Domain of unknown function (DUF4270)